MKMNYLYALAVLPLLFGAGKVMAADGATTGTHQDTRVLPVLVQVDSHGNVTRVDPASDLKPTMQKLLKQTLDDMITKPAHDAHGKPISSQFVANMKMQSVKRKDGGYGFKFTYVSAQPVPAGQWVWSHDPATHKVVLANQSMLSNMNDQNARARRSATRQAVHQRQMAAMAAHGNGH